MNEKDVKDYFEDMITEGQYKGDVVIARDDENILKAAVGFIEELQRYRKIGTAEELMELKEGSLNGLELAKLAAAVRRLEKYEETGTVWEFHKAKERQTPKKIIDDGGFGMCPHCRKEFNSGVSI